jgi:hypothetical protein
MLYWDYSQYNAVVKNIENCSDTLHMVADGIDRQGAPPNRIAKRLQKHARQAAIDLDKRALRMLAMYDSYAQDLVRQGVHYDPRRAMFKRPAEVVTPQPIEPVKGKRRHA